MPKRKTSNPATKDGAGTTPTNGGQAANNNTAMESSIHICPMCSKCCNEQEIGHIDGVYLMGDVPIKINAYGCLPGFGCNQDITKVEG